jgi:predicted alpha/beta superfamily hydrolase
MKIEEIKTNIRTLNRDVTVRVMTPNGYESSDKRYPVLYINDGQDVFKDNQSYQGESLKFEQYYNDYGKFVPEIILVSIEAPRDPATRTAQYSPYHKRFNVPPEKKFEPEIIGKGNEYLDWMTTDLKSLIDIRYRTLPGREYTGICGYSTGGLNSIYAVLKYSKVFTRMIAMSAAVCIWMDIFSQTLKSSSYEHLKYVYIDVGTNEFGRMTTKEEFLQGAQDIFECFRSKGIDDTKMKYNIYSDAIHHQKEWAKRFPDAIRWIFQDI